MATPTTTQQEARMYQQPDTSTRVGRMLDGLIRSSNRKAKVGLTVDITKASGAKYHQAFRVKGWDAKDGTRMLTLDLDDGDYMAGTYATKVAHLNTATGKLAPARGMQDAALLYAAQAAVHYAYTGSNLQPSNGTVEVTEQACCGSCGLTLTHPVSIELGIGPECAKRVGLEHHYKGTALTTRAKAAKAKEQEAAPAAPAAPAPQQAAGADPSTWPAGYCEHGVDYMQCWHCHKAYLATVDADIYSTQAQANAAANARNYDLAQQLHDRLDTLRGMRGKALAEWDGNNSWQAWEARVAAHPQGSQLPPDQQRLVARWCYVNHASVEETLQAMELHTTAA